MSSTDGAGIFVGHYGTIVKVPADYTSIAGFLDQAQTHEVVCFFPQGTPREQLKETEYARLGAVRLEVLPRKSGGGLITLDHMRAEIPRRLSQNKEIVNVHEFQAHMPAFMLRIIDPLALTQVYLEGKELIYVLTAGADGLLLRGMIEGLRDR